MKILISEKQKKSLIRESIQDNLSEIINQSYKFTKLVLEKTSKQIGLDLRFLISWGATIGGILKPMDDFIKGKFPELTDVQISLLLTGIIANYFFDNQKLIKRLNDKIEEEGITAQFKSILKKSENLKKVFITFIESLSLTIHKVTNIISYSFLIPLIPILYESVNSGNLKISDAKEVTNRLLSFGFLTISGVVLKEIITKLIKRFNSSD